MTPHDGFAYLFRVPDRQQYPFAFKTHPNVRDFPGIELRGQGGYQLVPSSHVDATARDPAGDYRFDAGWTLARLMVDLVDLPDWLLDLWITLDRGAQNFGRDEPATLRKTRKPASAAGQPTNLTPPSPQNLTSGRKRDHPQRRTTTKQELLKSGAPVDITTVLSAEKCSRFRGTLAYGCGLHLVRLLGQPGAWLENKHTFHCILPGHRESTPSARWMWQADGSLLYHDLHVRSEQRMYWAVPEVYAACITGTLAKLRDPSMKIWSIRLAVDAGLTEPYPIPKPVVPVDAPPLVRTVVEGIWLLFACKWTYEVEKASMLGQSFLGGWCGGIPPGSVWFALRWLLSRRLLMSYLDEERRTVYLPGMEWSL